MASLARTLQISSSSIQRALEILAEDELVMVAGKGRARRYALAEARPAMKAVEQLAQAAVTSRDPSERAARTKRRAEPPGSASGRTIEAAESDPDRDIGVGMTPGQSTPAFIAGQHTEVAERLVELGFSRYEARTYVGFLVSAGATGYSVANETGVPQPKVYETLRRLVDRGALVRIGNWPARYAAVPPEALLGSLEKEFKDRLEGARRDLAELPLTGSQLPPMSVTRLNTFDSMTQIAGKTIGRARKRVYLHGRSEELRALAPAVSDAADHNVEFVIVHFGALPFAKPRGQAVRHESTEGTLYPSRSTRHLAVVVDSSWSLWALARDGARWEGLSVDSALLAGLIKSYIRHDLFVQRMYADAPALFEERYGPGLLRLGDAPAEEEVESAGGGAL